MKKSRAARLNLLILLLFLLPLISIGFKLAYYKDTLFGKPIAKESLVVSQKFKTERNSRDTTNLLLPSQSSHQRISNEHIQSSAASFFVKDIDNQRCLKINPHSRRQGISYSYEYSGKAIKYEIDPTLYYDDKRNTFLKDFLFRSFYESNGDQIAFEEKLKAESIPYRVVCGYDAVEEEPKLKKWIEVEIAESWVPFDVPKGLFAEKPASYVDLGPIDAFSYKEPDSLHTKITKGIYLNPELLEDGISVPMTILFFTEIFNLNDMPLNILAIILLTPLAAMLITIFRNAIGIQTFGTFLPMLIAMSFLSTGFFLGSVLFIIVIAATGLFHYPLGKLGLLTLPKLAIILTTVEGVFLFLIYIGFKWDIALLLKTSLFPVVILTFATERFIKTSTDKGYGPAIVLALKTLLVSSFCFVIYKSIVFAYIFMVFPELFLCVIAINLSLGTWIGLRMSEVVRFKSLEKAK
jgi:hypothetical protein